MDHAAPHPEQHARTRSSHHPGAADTPTTITAPPLSNAAMAAFAVQLRKTAAPARAAAPTATAAAKKHSAAYLNAAKRRELRDIARFRLGLANTAYADACNAITFEDKLQAVQTAALTGSAISLVAGLGAPLFAVGIAGLAAKLPANASTSAYRAAVAGLDTKKVEYFFKNGIETAKLVKSATKPRDVSMKQMMLDLAKAFAVHVDQVNQDLPHKSVIELGVLAAGLDPSIVSQQTYSDKLEKIAASFKDEVLKIGKLSMLYRVGIGSGHWAYARADASATGGQYGSPLIIFRTWVNPRWASAAVAKAKDKDAYYGNISFQEFRKECGGGKLPNPPR